MIVNLWSTPRTGSNWYSQYLFKKYSSENKRTQLYTQYLNQYHFINYIKPNYSDFVYEYENGCYYKYYTFDHLRQSISYTNKSEKRIYDNEHEEKYRLELLNKHNHKKNPSIFYNHIAPMSDLSYNTLFDIADKNIFLYRKDIKRQISSYTLAYGTAQYKQSVKIYENVTVEYGVMKNLVDRIIKWHKLDKTNCEIICYEDLEFDLYADLPKQQNKIDPFTQLSSNTQEHILNLVDYFNKSIEKIV